MPVLRFLAEKLFSNLFSCTPLASPSQWLHPALCRAGRCGICGRRPTRARRGDTLDEVHDRACGVTVIPRRQRVVRYRAVHEGRRQAHHEYGTECEYAYNPSSTHAYSPCEKSSTQCVLHSARRIQERIAMLTVQE